MTLDPPPPEEIKSRKTQRKNARKRKWKQYKEGIHDKIQKAQDRMHNALYAEPAWKG